MKKLHQIIEQLFTDTFLAGAISAYSQLKTFNAHKSNLEDNKTEVDFQKFLKDNEETILKLFYQQESA
jgi:hypothetical protein